MSKKAPITIDAETGDLVGTELDAGIQDAVLSCNRLHALALDNAQKAQNLATQAAHYAILIGLQLQHLKPQIAHGGWEALFGAESEEEGRFVFTIRTAQKYMRAAEAAVSSRLNGREAKQLQAAAATGLIDEGAEKLLRKAADGQTLRQLYLDLGIIQPNAKERLEQVRNTSGRIDLGEVTPAERAKLALGPACTLLDRYRSKALGLLEGMPMQSEKEWTLPDMIELLEHYLAAAKEAKRKRTRL